MCLDVFIILFFLTLNGPSAAALTQETGVEVCCSMGEGSLVIRPSLTNPLMAFEKPCGAEQEPDWVTVNTFTWTQVIQRYKEKSGLRKIVFELLLCSCLSFKNWFTRMHIYSEELIIEGWLSKAETSYNKMLPILKMVCNGRYVMANSFSLKCVCCTLKRSVPLISVCAVWMP